MNIEKLQELNQAIQDNPEMPERIKSLVQQQTQCLEYLNACVEMNTKLVNQLKSSDEYAILNGERIYPNIGRKPLPLPDWAYREADGTIVIPIKQ